MKNIIKSVLSVTFVACSCFVAHGPVGILNSRAVKYGAGAVFFVGAGIHKMFQTTSVTNSANNTAQQADTYHNPTHWEMIFGLK